MYNFCVIQSFKSRGCFSAKQILSKSEVLLFGLFVNVVLVTTALQSQRAIESWAYASLCKTVKYLFLKKKLVVSCYTFQLQDCCILIVQLIFLKVFCICLPLCKVTLKLSVNFFYAGNSEDVVFTSSWTSKRDFQYKVFLSFSPTLAHEIPS